MISLTAEYCLRAVLCLASAAPRPQTSRQIARTTRIPPGYLCKILQSLGRAGIVSAQRGLNGGFVLLPDPAALSLLQIVRIADPSPRITTCPLGIHGKNLCPLHRRLDDAAAMSERVLAGATIAQLLTAPGEPPCASENPSPGPVCPCLTGDAP